MTTISGILKARITTTRNAPFIASVTLIDPETQEPYLYEYETYKFQDQFVQEFLLPKSALPMLSGIASIIGFWSGQMTADIRYIVEVLEATEDEAASGDSREIASWHVCNLCSRIAFARDGDKDVKCSEDGTLLAAFG